jgi:DNA-binding IclR family transcriptional regulator
VSEGRYVSQAERARRLMERGVAAWQQLQTFAMAHDETVDSVVLQGQELWLPHHETEGRRFRVTLVVGVHYPAEATEEARRAVAEFVHRLEQESSDEDGTLSVQAEEG